jgi:hypothetical protein
VIKKSIIIFLIVLLASGYFVYAFYLKKDNAELSFTATGLSMSAKMEYRAFIHKNNFDYLIGYERVSKWQWSGFVIYGRRNNTWYELIVTSKTPPLRSAKLNFQQKELSEQEAKYVLKVFNDLTLFDLPDQEALEQSCGDKIVPSIRSEELSEYVSVELIAGNKFRKTVYHGIVQSFDTCKSEDWPKIKHMVAFFESRL